MCVCTQSHICKLSFISGHVVVIYLHLQTGNNTLIGSLVRLPDNHLHLTESERVLRNEEKFQELVQLFRTKGKHSKGFYYVYICL